MNDEHNIRGWYCGHCDTFVPVKGVIPAVEVVDGPDGELTPVLTLTADEGHSQVVTLGWNNLAILTRQMVVARAQDPEAGPDFLDSLDPRQREAVILAVFAKMAQRERKHEAAR